MTTPARHLRAAAHALDKQLAGVLRPIGLTPPLYDALTAYAAAGLRGTASADLARHLGYSAQAAWHLTHALDKRGLIGELRPDGLRQPRAITADGTRLLKRAAEAVAPVEARAARLLGVIGARAVANTAEQLRRPARSKSRRTAP